jgi:hypothetical protein
MTEILAQRQTQPRTRLLTGTTRGFGVFYLAMAWGVNALATLPAADETMRGFERDSWIPLYQDLLGALIVPNAHAVVIATIAFETVIGAVMLFGGNRLASWAMLAGTAWCIGLLPALAWPYIAVMPPLILAQFVLFLRLRRASQEQP